MHAKRIILGIVCFSVFVFGQAVTFHNPVPWITLRDNTIIAKTLVDTAVVKKNAIKLTLSKVENGKEKRILSKRFKATDYSHEYELGSFNNDIIGGNDFLSISWEVVGTDKKGTVEPFGIVKLADEDPGKDALVCKQVSGALTVDALRSTLKDSDFITLGTGVFAPVWNKEKFGLVCKNCSDIESVSFSVDGKNGKNAFLAYSDRICNYYPKNDSIHTVYYKRGFKDNAIQNNEKKWKQEITKEAKDGLVLIAIPWYDLAIIPNDGRIFGFAAFAQASETTAAVPQAAKKEIPGTWGSVILKK